MGIISFLLTILGIYSIGKIIISLYVLSTLSIIYTFVHRKEETCKSFRLEIKKPELIFIILFSFVALYLYAGFPTWYLDGGRDPGLYTIFGINISKNGGLYLEISDTKLISETFGQAVRLDFPSIHYSFLEGFSNSEDHRSPDFFHLVPAYFAIGYDLFGMDGLFRVNSIFGYFSVFFFYLIVRKILDPVSAIFAIILYVLNVSQLWNVRSVLTETFSQFLILFTVYSIQTFFRETNKWVYSLIGVCFGLSLFARVDSYLYFPVIVLYSVFVLLFSEKYFKNTLYFIFTFLVLNILSLVYAYFYSRVYMAHLWERGFLEIVLTLSLISIFVLMLEISLWRNKGVLDKIRGIYHKNIKFIRLFFFMSISALGIYAYFIRPEIQAKIFSGIQPGSFFALNSLPIFLWYVPVWLFIFLPFALDTYLIRKNKSHSIFLFLLGTFLLVSYLLNPSIAADHLWASRRWMLFSIPFAILGSLVGIRNIPISNRTIKLLVLLVFGGAATIHTYWRSKLILSQSMMEGYVKGYENFVQGPSDGESIYFTNKVQIASPLRYIYGKNIFLINDSEEFIRRVPDLLTKRKNIYIIQNGDLSGSSAKLKFSLTGDLQLSGLFPDESIYRFPEFLYKKNLNYQIYKIEKSKKAEEPDPIQFEWIPGESGFLSSGGKTNEDGTISATRHEGNLVYGPFLTLSKGKYRLDYSGRNLDHAKFDVAYNKGLSLLSPQEKGEVPNSKTLLFEITNSVIDDVEFRVFVAGKSGVQIQRIFLKRI